MAVCSLAACHSNVGLGRLAFFLVLCLCCAACAARAGEGRPASISSGGGPELCGCAAGPVAPPPCRVSGPVRLSLRVIAPRRGQPHLDQEGMRELGGGDDRAPAPEGGQLGPDRLMHIALSWLLASSGLNL